MDLSLFFGRFHPVIVHLPIGFLVLAGLIELLTRKEKFQHLSFAVSYSLFWGALTGVIAVVFGLLLAGSGEYDEGSLYWHRLLGIIVALTAILTWLIKSGRISLSRKIYSWLLSVMVLLVFITGHLGGVITHGKNYLVQYAPRFVQGMLIEQGSKTTRDLPLIPDSLEVYEHLINPIFEAKCIKCHNENDLKGGLALSDPELVAKGGENGEIIKPGNPFESEIFYRVTLPQTSRKFMPPKSEPLTFGEISLLQWWISQGGSYEAKLTQDSVPDFVQAILLRDYQYDMKPRSYVDVALVEPLTAKDFVKLESNGLKVRMLAHENYLLEVEPMRKPITKDQIGALLSAKEQITLLNLSKSGVTDEMLSVISKLPNLTSLRLQQNPITDQGVASLKGLEHLESLNLYGTEVSDASIEIFKSLPALRKIYLWRTKVTADRVGNLRSAKANLEIDTGYEPPPKSLSQLQPED